MRERWDRLGPWQKAAVGALVVAGAPALIAGMIAGAKDSMSGGAEASSTAAPAAVKRPAPGPTFTYPGGPECTITYRAVAGRTSWTAVTTVDGELITHATDSGGGIHRHDDRTKAGTTTYTAPMPLDELTDLGGNLSGAGGRSYGCSVGPAR